jgi:hypothetical protein
MNKEVSAVEWLMSQALKWNKDNISQNDFIEFPKDAFKKAKEIELKNNINQWKKGWDDAFDLMQVSRTNIPK